MRNYLPLLLLTGLLGLAPGQTLLAQDNEATDTEAVVERANHLKSLLDKLLEQSNHSSIQKALNGGDAGDALIEKALRLKAEGEQFLADEDYMKAAMTLQAALDHVFQAIRANDNGAAAEKAANGRLADAIATNDTFILAATRVVNGEPNGKAVDFLAQAREARTRADASVANSDTEAALQELEDSTHLAQQAIVSVRDGKVIERGQ